MRRPYNFPFIFSRNAHILVAARHYKHQGIVHIADELMPSHNKVLDKILRGTSDSNIRFDDLRSLLRGLGFDERIQGSHHIFTRNGIEEIVNIQPKGGNAKPYQVKQVRNLILKYGLGGQDDSI